VRRSGITSCRETWRRERKHPLWPVAHLLAKEGNLGKAGRPMGWDGDEVEKEVEIALGKNVEHLREIGCFGVGK
jgi:hypothetical protein